MTTQIFGTLKTWNQDKGFGFVTPANGGRMFSSTSQATPELADYQRSVKAFCSK